MKQGIYLFALLVTIVLTACGGEEAVKTTEEVTTGVNLKGLEPLDLTEYGFNLSIMVPKADINGVPDIKLTERGTLEIVIGMDYGIEIMYGDGDIELLKTDLKEDLVFTAEILSEEKNMLVYTQDIPDSGVKIQNHFMYRAEVGADVYEVRDLVAKDFGLGMIEKMLESAKTIKAASGVEAAV